MGFFSATASNAERLTKLSLQSRSAETDADRGRPSIIAMSPTIEPGPSIARMRSAPVGATMLTLSRPDRKSTRLNSSHLGISYAVFCLKKKKINKNKPMKKKDKDTNKIKKRKKYIKKLR